MNNKLLTIVIPVYNVERYIRECLDSVIVSSEWMDLLEVIVVNDGTPDNSGLIAREYADKYPETIYVVDKDNGGHGSAWNLGLKKAKGKYLRFLDSDDWLSNLQSFLMVLSSIDVDIVFTSLNFINDANKSSTIMKIHNVLYNKKYDSSQFSFIDTKNQYRIYNFHWCTYRTELLRQEQPLFVEGVSYDDSILLLAPMILCKSLYFTDIQLYNYRRGIEGQSYDPIVLKRRAWDYVPVCRSMASFVDNHTNLTKNQIIQRDAILWAYMIDRFKMFTSLPYSNYKKVMKDWFPIIESLPNFSLTRKMRLYKYAPTIVSWCIIRLFDKFDLK